MRRVRLHRAHEDFTKPLAHFPECALCDIVRGITRPGKHKMLIQARFPGAPRAGRMLLEEKLANRAMTCHLPPLWHGLMKVRHATRLFGASKRAWAIPVATSLSLRKSRTGQRRLRSPAGLAINYSPSNTPQSSHSNAT